MLALLGLNRIAAYVIVAVIAVGACTSLYYVWKNSIEQRALAHYNQQQLEQIVVDQQRLIRQQETLAEEQKVAQEQQRIQTQQITARVQAVTRTIDAAADRPASQVLRDVVGQLSRGATNDR